MEMSDLDPEDILEKGRVPELIKTFAEINAFVSLLRCQICYQLMTSPVMTITGCSHNFCSLCLRNYLLVQQNCPSCLGELYETQIKPNKIVQEIVSISKILLPKLSEIVFNQKSALKFSTPLESSPPQNDVSVSTVGRTDASMSKSFVGVPDKTQIFSQSSAGLSQAVEDQPGTSRGRPPKGHVSCPICSTFVPEGNINRHLDEICLNGGGPDQVERSKPSNSTSPSSVLSQSAKLTSPVGLQSKLLTSKSSFFSSTQSTNLPAKKSSMKPVTKVVYNLMRDSQLRDLLKKEGLETKGDRKTLINRHQKFSVYWNSQCEEDNPMSRAEIIRAVKRDEQNLSSVGVTLGAVSTSSSGASKNLASIFSYDRKTDDKLIDTKRKEILKDNKSAFSKLIEDVKRRKLEVSKSDAKTSIGVINDGDLQEVDDHSVDADATVVGHDANEKENVLSSQSSDDDFVTPTPDAKASFKKSDNFRLKSSTNRQPKTPTKVDSYFTKTPKKSPAVNNLTNGTLYVTPKRKSSRELLFDEPKRLRQQVIDASGSQQRAQSLPKSECPVCHSLVAVHLMSSHVDRCLNQEKTEPRRSNRKGATTKSTDPPESDPDDPDSDFETDVVVCAPDIDGFERASSPDLSKPPPLTSTVKKAKKKIVIKRNL